MDRLIEKIIEKNNPSVVGLDPCLEYIPEYIKSREFDKYGKNLKGAAEAILCFNKAIIDSVYDIVPAVKPQSAYYEMYGFEGVRVLCETIAYAKEKGLYVIVDGKRNDIGSTASAYSMAYLGVTDVCGEKVSSFGADCLTVNGYLGSDGLKPFIEDCEKYDNSLFMLVKTSNPSSGELQDLTLENGRSVYEYMATIVTSLGKSSIGKYGFSRVGAVVGATYPKQLSRLRESFPEIFFLVPGYGFQGGGADGIKSAFNEKGLGAIVNSSRGIMCAYKKAGAPEERFAKCAREEALRMKKDFAFLNMENNI